MDRIVLKNMVFYGYHGDLPEENELGQRFHVDVSLSLDASKAGETDRLEDSINYAEVYGVVADIMNNERCHLLERAGALIADRIWQTYHGVVGVAVSIRKPSVPIAGAIDYVEVTITRGNP